MIDILIRASTSRISEPDAVRIPEELDPPIGGAATLITVRLLEIDKVSRIKIRPVKDRLRLLTSHTRITIIYFDISLILDYQEEEMLFNSYRRNGAEGEIRT